jgi:hypothetical protein
MLVEKPKDITKMFYTFKKIKYSQTERKEYNKLKTYTLIFSSKIKLTKKMENYIIRIIFTQNSETQNHLHLHNLISTFMWRHDSIVVNLTLLVQEILAWEVKSWK